MPSQVLTHKEEIEFLKKNGFPTNPLNEEADDLKKIWKIQEKLYDTKNSLKYPIDGLVVKLNDNSLVESLGVVGKTNRGWCAIKFVAKETVTKIIGLTWQVGRTGRVTPVAELEPVQLEGTIVKRATLHNYQEFLTKDIKLNDQIVIRKAGDIIPEIVKVMHNLRKKNVEKINIPDECPECKTKLIISETSIDLYCPNKHSCPAQVLGRLSYFAQRNIANIDGLSEKIIQKFIEEFGIANVADLYDLPYEKIFELEGFGQKSIDNLKKSIQKVKKLEDYKFLAGLSIEGVGPEIAKLIIKKIKQNKV